MDPGFPQFPPQEPPFLPQPFPSPQLHRFPRQEFTAQGLRTHQAALGRLQVRPEALVFVPEMVAFLAKSEVFDGFWTVKL